MKRFRSDLDVNYDPQGDAYGDYDYVMTEEEKEYEENNEAFDDDYSKVSSYMLPEKTKRKAISHISKDDLVAAIKADDFFVVQAAYKQGKLFEDNKSQKEKKFIQSLIFHASSPEMVEFLIDRGLNPNVKNEEGQTLAHIIADNCRWSYKTSFDYLPILNKLIDLNVDMNVTDNKGKTPLYLMLKGPKMLHAGYLRTAERMVRLGVDINQPDNRGVTLYDHAIKHKKTNLLKFIKLLRQISPEPQKIISNKKVSSLTSLNKQNEKN